MLPVPASKVTPKAPFKLLFNTILPGPPTPVLRITFPANSMARLIWSNWSAVTMSPASRLEPRPFCRNWPVEVMSPAAVVVNRPALVTVTLPPVASGASTVSAAPVKANAPERLTAPPSVVVPVPADCVKLAASNAPRATLAAETTVTAPSGAEPPTAPEKLMEPMPAVRLRAWPPLTEPLKVMSPAPAPVDSAMPPASATEPPKAMAVEVVVMSPARLLAPAPFCVKPPVAVMSPAAAVVNWPELVTSMLPPTVAGALTVRAAPVKSRLPVRLRAPASVVVPVPACCVRLAAEKAPRFTSAAETTVTAPRREAPPTEALKAMFPVPAVRLRALAPLTAPLKVMSPASAPVDSAMSPARVTDPPKAMAVEVVVMSPARLLAPAPFCVKPPVAVMSPAAAVVNWPELVTSTVPPAASAALTISAEPVKSRLPPRLTAPFSVVVPVPACCVRLAAVKAPRVTSAAETTVTAPSGVEPPTTPEKLMEPVPAVRLRALGALAPLTAPLKVMSPAAEPVETAMSSARVTAEAKDTGAETVVMSPDRLLAPVPLWVKPPSARMLPAEEVVKAPELATVTAPAASMSALTARAEPVKANEPPRVMAPATVVAPVPATCVKLAASTAAEKVRSSAEETTMAPMAPEAPTAPEKVMSPAPADRVRFRELPALLMVPTVRSPLEPSPVASVTADASATLPSTIGALEVCTVPARRTVPPTRVVSTPEAKVATSSAPLPRVRSPAFCSVVEEPPVTVTSSLKARS